MSFTGKTFKVNFRDGGFSGSTDLSSLPPEAFIEPSRNINLHNGVREKRGGTDKVNSTALSGMGRVLGGVQFRKQDLTSYIVTGDDQGNVVSNYVTAIGTGMSTTGKYSFCVSAPDDKLLLANGSDPVKVWTGTGSIATISSPATDWSGGNQPSQILIHSKGASRRAVALGVPSYTNTVYLSATGSVENFGVGSVVRIVVDTGDGYGIVGAAEFGETLLMFSKRNAYELDDSDASSVNWGYHKAQFTGGVAHSRLICVTPNDIVCMMDDGDIYSVTAAQSFGNYKLASITRPSFMHTWIRENVDLTRIADFHCIYDEKLKAIRFFVTKQGNTKVDTCLIYYIDRQPEQAWAIHDGVNNFDNSGYYASCSFRVQTSDGSVLTYTGDYKGYVWQLERSNKSDNSNAYYGGFRTSHLNCSNDRTTKRFTGGRLIFLARGGYNVTVRWWVDSVEQTSRTVTFSGRGAVVGTALVGTDSLVGGQEFAEVPIEFGAVGQRIQVEVSNSGAAEDFAVSQLLIDFEDLGARPY